jgi:PIN domain nuclease of toxin-antitoxin system
LIALLDTHTFLWAVLNDQRLSDAAREVWTTEGDELYLSVASVWEVAIKVSLGKLSIDRPLEQYFREELNDNGVQLLPLRIRDAAKVVDLPFHHRDPFDRLIIAQALEDGIPIISVDSMLDSYGVKRIW